MLLHGCQLHAQKAKSRLDYIGRNQFVLTFTVCHASGEKKKKRQLVWAPHHLVQHSLLNTNVFIYFLPVQCLQLTLVAPVSLCTAALFLSTDLTSAPRWIPPTPCPLLGQKCPHSSRVPFVISKGNTVSPGYLLQHWSHSLVPPSPVSEAPKPNWPVISPSPSSPLVLTLPPSVVFAHPIKSSPSRMPSMFSIWVLLFTWSLSPSSRCDRLI